jgi:hypothetical protein
MGGFKMIDMRENLIEMLGVTEDKMEKIDVIYLAGQPRDVHAHPGGVDYMLVEVDGVELYVECDPDDEDETGTYDDLKAEILLQAKEHGIDPGILKFMYDDEEGAQ